MTPCIACENARVNFKLFYRLFMHLFCNLLLALGLNTCLKAVQTIAMYIEEIKCLLSAKEVFIFFLRFACVIFACTINTDKTSGRQF